MSSEHPPIKPFRKLSAFEQRLRGLTELDKADHVSVGYQESSAEFWVTLTHSDHSRPLEGRGHTLHQAMDRALAHIRA